MLGLVTWGQKALLSPTSSINNIFYTELKNSVVDELHIRERTDILTDNIKIIWQRDTRLLAKFLNSLSAGNIDNQDIPIIKFAIKRRRYDELKNLILGYLPFVNDTEIEYIDYTQPVGDFIYSVTPVSENGFEGKPNEVHVESIFTGVWLVDKNDNFVFGFDKQWDGELRALNIVLEQDRIEIPSLSKYRSVYYTPEEFARFTISALVTPTNYSFTEWQKLVSKLSSHVPLIVKSGSGDLYVCDVYSPQKSTWLVNAYKTVDPIVFTVSCMELMSIEEYLEN